MRGDVGNDARAAWKTLKTEYQDRVQEVEELICTFQLRMDELQGKRQKLKTLLSTLQNKVLYIYNGLWKIVKDITYTFSCHMLFLEGGVWRERENRS